MLLARLSDGGMRDALSLLDVCRRLQEVLTADSSQKTVGIVGKRTPCKNIMDAIIERDAAAALKQIDILYQGSLEPQRLCESLSLPARPHGRKGCQRPLRSGSRDGDGISKLREQSKKLELSQYCRT